MFASGTLFWACQAARNRVSACLFLRGRRLGVLGLRVCRVLDLKIFAQFIDTGLGEDFAFARIVQVGPGIFDLLL